MSGLLLWDIDSCYWFTEYGMVCDGGGRGGVGGRCEDVGRALAGGEGWGSDL